MTTTQQHARRNQTPERLDALRHPAADRAAEFTSVYDACCDDVARWIRAMGVPAADQEDMIQEVFAVVHRRLAHFDGQNLKAWLYRITAHRVRDYRRLAWVKHMFQRSDPLAVDVAADGPTPLMVLETREKQRQLDALLGKLSQTLRATIVLFEIEGYTAHEIASLQDVPVNTVRARLLRARRRLAAVLGDEPDRGGDA